MLWRRSLRWNSCWIAYLHDLFSSKYGPSSVDDFTCPFIANPSIQALYELMRQNKESLEREIYKASYFISGSV